MLTFLLFVTVVAALFGTVRLYNGLRKHAEAVKRAQSNLLGELRKRATLVNQLIEVCKGYGDHEKLTHLTVSAAVQQEADAGQLARASTSVLAGVNLVADRFPELKANETYRTLMEQLKDIEERLQSQRERLNEEVEAYNHLRGRFPAVLVAGSLGYPEAPYFTTDEAGLDAGAMFKTDDGEILRAQLTRLGRGVGEATRQIGNRAGEAMKAAQGQMDRPVQIEQDVAPPMAADAGDPPPARRPG